MKSIKTIIIGVNLLLLLGYFGWSVAAEERILKQGKLILLELVPADPRSLMQGDYMRLRYRMNEGTDTLVKEKRGFCILNVSTADTGTFIRIQKEKQPLRSGEVAIKYFYSGSRFFKHVNIGAESYFFEEGTGKKYANARYGGLRLDDEGNSVLVGLYDEHRKLIE